MKPLHRKLRTACRVLSAVFLGVFTAPILSFIWLAVPWLRYFPAGDDSPHAIGIPIGFCIGAFLATKLNRRFNWGRRTAYTGLALLLLSLLASFAIYSKMLRTPGWDGLGWLVALLVAAHVVVALLGLTLSGLFSHLGRHRVQPPVAIP
ncbi:MAG: hypothetical protein N2A42_12905 [Luteolibacter sp.]